MDRTPPRFREPLKEEKEDSDTEEEEIEKQEEKELVPEEPPQPAVKKKVSCFVEVSEESIIIDYRVCSFVWVNVGYIYMCN